MPMVQAADLRYFAPGDVNRAWAEQSRRRREAEETLVRRQEAEELAGYRRRHQEELAQATPGRREEDTLSGGYRQNGERPPKRLEGSANELEGRTPNGGSEFCLL